jgi:hypothetical protein
MQTYWDLSERERAALSREDVERFADVELMTKGVLRVVAPELEPMPTVPEPDRDVFTVSHPSAGRVDFCFATAEQARAFVALKPIRRAHHYVDGLWVDYLEESTEWKIAAERGVSEDLATLHRTDFFRAKEIKARNEKRTNNHQAAAKAQQEALSSLWADWNTCRDKARQLTRVADTFAEYSKLAGGDAATAFRFLLRSFTSEQVAEAVDWAVVALPVGFVRMGERIEEISAGPIPDAHFAEAQPAQPEASIPF